MMSEWLEPMVVYNPFGKERIRKLILTDLSTICWNCELIYFLCDILGNSLDCWDNVFLVCCIHSSRRCFNWKYWNASEKYYQHHAIVIMPQSSQWKKRLIVWQRLQFSRKFWHTRYNTHAFVYSLRFHMSVLPLLFVWCALKCILHSSTCRPIISQGGDTDRNANTFTERVAVI